MDLFISDKKLRRAFEKGALEQRYGTEMARKIDLRLAALQAALSLADFWPPYSGPERCHELKHNLSGVFSFDLKYPYRLLFKSTKEIPHQDYPDEHQRWELITAVELLAIEDTHE